MRIIRVTDCQDCHFYNNERLEHYLEELLKECNYDKNN